jgi:hypothetical protein
VSVFWTMSLAGQNAAVTINVNASASRRPINPLIYGVAFASTAELLELNAPLNRSGGNGESLYNWQVNASNRGSDWFFESLEDSSGATAGAAGDQFISDSKAGAAQPMLTIPMVGWVAKLGPNRERLSSFSIAKYGAQKYNDWQWFPDAGNGVKPDGTRITNNDPNDANIQVDSLFQKAWVQHLVTKWGTSSQGGLRYYLLDNEPSIWQEAHRDVHPIGPTMDEIRDKAIDYSTKIKSVDPAATVFGPEEWGWSGFFYSGYDQQYAAAHSWCCYPDRDAHGGADFSPWYLAQMKTAETNAGKRLLDYFSLHYYPQGGEFGENNDVSEAMQLRRNRSTRSLWDPAYRDESWIDDYVKLVPRMRAWVEANYPGTKIALTEYNWGAEGHINGATAQADILGILGREGMDLATRWTTPESTTPTFKAMKMYRNYDGSKSGFGDTSVSTTVPNPDNLSAFGALRTSDGALTIMVVSKVLSGSTPLTINLAGFANRGVAEVWQLTSSNAIQRLTDLSVSPNSLTTSVPAQSITLFVLPPAVNGKPNIFWRNGTTGQNAIWVMRGSTLSAVVDLAGLANTAYAIQGVADMNGDGTKDVVWRNQSSGQNALWLLNANGAFQGVVDLPAMTNSDLSVQATGDFNGDGKNDLVWRNQATGQTFIWWMNGTQYAGTANLPTIANGAYRIGGCGDFDRDGYTDLVWRNYSTGQNALWLLKNTTVLRVVDLPALPNTNYEISGVADMTLDNAIDIIWRNNATGQNAVWKLDGTRYVGVVDLPALPNTAYRIVGPR